jgi:hypothetical protein
MIIDNITNAVNLGIYLITGAILVTGAVMFYQVVVIPIREVLKR